MIPPHLSSCCDAVCDAGAGPTLGDVTLVVGIVLAVIYAFAVVFGWLLERATAPEGTVSPTFAEWLRAHGRFWRDCWRALW